LKFHISKKGSIVESIKSFSGYAHGFLSNFHPVSVVLDGETYPSVEHAYQAAKTLNIFERRVIQNATTAGKAKRLGGLLASIRPDWNDVKISVMRDLIRQKFDYTDAAHADLCSRLLRTYDAVLIEGNYWKDYFWGVCDGIGQNWLGQLLMERRDQVYAMRSEKKICY